MERSHFRQVQMGDALSVEVAARYSKAASTRGCSSACRQGEGGHRKSRGQISARDAGKCEVLRPCLSSSGAPSSAGGTRGVPGKPRCHIILFPDHAALPSSPYTRKKRPSMLTRFPDPKTVPQYILASVFGTGFRSQEIAAARGSPCSKFQTHRRGVAMLAGSRSWSRPLARLF